MQKILIVENDDSIVHTLKEYLRGENFETTSVSGQKSAEDQIYKHPFDLLLADVSLDDGDGFCVCSAAKKINLPVIFLTASGDENSVIKGLDMGADDYISKPFRPRELVSRIRNVLRHYSSNKTIVMLENVAIDTEKGTIKKNNKEINLSALEYRLLLTFVNNRGHLLSRNKLLEDIWDIAGDFVNDNTLTVYIKRLREKIENDPQNPSIIKTVRGIGYRVD